MRVFFTLFWKELKGFFLNPAYHVAAAFLMCVNVIPFVIALLALDDRHSSKSLVYITFNNYWFWIVFSLLAPLITMRIFVDEHKQGTMEILMTAPINAFNIVLSKFAACMVYYVAIWLPSFAHFYNFELITGQSSAFDDGQLYGAAIMVFLLGVCYVAVGCWASCVARNQMVAAGLTLGVFLAHLFFGFLPFMTERIGVNLMLRVDYFSMLRHMHFFCSGLIDSRPIILYGSGGILALILAVNQLSRQRWKV